MASGTTTPTFSTSQAPRTPSASMVATTRRRRISVTWPRWPTGESAPMPVSVMVSSRCGQSEEVANVALFLASAESSKVTGIDLVADGGTKVW